MKLAPEELHAAKDPPKKAKSQKHGVAARLQREALFSPADSRSARRRPRRVTNRPQRGLPRPAGWGPGLLSAEGAAGLPALM